MREPRSTILRTGARRKAGEIFKNPRMAKTLRRIADEGPDVFYKGDIAWRRSSAARKRRADCSRSKTLPIIARLGGAGYSELPGL